MTAPQAIAALLLSANVAVSVANHGRVQVVAVRASAPKAIAHAALQFGLLWWGGFWG